MDIKYFSQKRKRSGYRGQAMVEFAIALPILLVLLFGIMEVSRILLMYALVINGSRDAVRYASSVGIESTSEKYARYKYCDGIEAIADQSSYFVVLNPVIISYDTGPGTSSLGVCDANGGEDTHITASSGDRVTVTVSTNYTPLVRLLPFQTRTISATSSRTIIGIFELDN
jgi:Flp pilus assembly protein TadG